MVEQGGGGWRAGSPPKVAPQIFALRHLAIETYPLHPPFSLLPPVTPPFCREAARAAAVGQAGRQKPRQKKKFPLALPEVTEVQLPGKTGLCIFKTSEGATWPSSKAQVRGKKIESCQMIFVLSNDLGSGEWGGGWGGGDPQNSCERSLQTSLSLCYIFITFLFPGLTWRDFNCLHF